MDPRLKNIARLFRDETLTFEQLAQELAPFRPAMERNEADNFAHQTFSRLHREWLAKRPACN